jgi:DEAD/DEAH box helicase domain-containing protein
MHNPSQAELFARHLPQEIYLDVETRHLSHEVEGGWERIRDFGLAVAVTWDAVHGFREWYEADAQGLIQELQAIPRLITFNGERFDFVVLSAYADVKNLYKNSLDLLADLTRILGRRVGLDMLARDTLGIQKTGSGFDAVRWWREGRKEKVVEYCRHDVQLLRDLVTFAREKGFVVLDGRRVPVKWD